MSIGMELMALVAFWITLLTVKWPFFKRFCCAVSRQASEHLAQPSTACFSSPRKPWNFDGKSFHYGLSSAVPPSSL